jgi:hypothetical protein
MPQAIAVPIRLDIVRRHGQGQSLADIAQDRGLPYGTVRQIWRHHRDQDRDGLRPRYERCGHPGPRGDARVIRAACWLKRRHPGWGAVLIGQLIHQRWPDRPMPHERTLQRWFRQAGVNRSPRRPTPQDRRRGGRPHEVWQADAVERVPLADGGRASWLTVTDEASGAILAAELSPPATLGPDPAVVHPRCLARDLHTMGTSRAIARR